MHACRVATDEGVPAEQRLTVGDETIATAMWQPCERHHIFGRDLDAVGYIFLAVHVVGVAVGVEAQIAAGNVGKRHLAGIFVLHPNLAAQAAAIADGFPFGGRHLGHRFLQKVRLRFFHGGEGSAKYVKKKR